MAFDYQGARQAGYSDQEIADYLAQQSNFDAAAARQAGYSDNEIIGHLAAPKVTPPPANSAATNPEFSLFGKQVTTPPTESGFNLPAAVISAGRTLDRLNQGISQVKTNAYGTIYQALGLDKAAGDMASQNAAQSAAMADEDSRFKQLQDVHPGSTLIGASLPALPLAPEALVATAGMSYGSPLERAASAGGALLGNTIAKGLGRMAQKQFEQGTEKAALQATKNAETQPFRDAGYVLPPAEANPTLLNRLLEGFSGGTKTEQAAAAKNQAITDTLAKQELPGIPALSAPALKADRAQAGQAYEALKNLGPFKLDNQFQQEVAALRPSISSEIPELANGQIDNLVQGLSKPQLSGQTAIDLLKQLRYNASVNFKNRIDPEKLTLAQAQSGAADALEGAIERNLQSSGNQNALQAFQAARLRIAKNYSVDNALNDATGHVDAQALAKQVAKGKPLSGGLKTAADFAASYPKSAQTINSATKANPFSVVDTFMSGLAATSAHNPLLMAGVFARPALRYGILSKPYQELMTTPSTMPVGLLGAKALNNPAAPYLAGLLGYEAASR